MIRAALPAVRLKALHSAGAFKAATPGSANAFLQRLCQQVKILAILKQTCNVLKTALEEVDVPEACAGSATFIYNGSLEFLVLGKGSHGFVKISIKSWEGNKSTPIVREDHHS